MRIALQRFHDDMYLGKYFFASSAGHDGASRTRLSKIYSKLLHSQRIKFSDRSVELGKAHAFSGTLSIDMLHALTIE